MAASTGAAADDRFNVCSVTINSDDEIRLLEKHLPASQFRFTELTDHARTTSADGGQSWLGRACRSDVRCDVLVVSGHFGNTWAGNYGTTFAGRSGIKLALDELEEQRCSESCAGVLGDPLEVFLFGCKTLADSEGPRLPPADLAAFGSQGLAPAAAARTADEARNGGEPTSSRERMRFVFAGVPRVYGFTDVAPSGERIAPFFERYLRSVGDYAAHLRRLRVAKAAREGFSPNAKLARALDRTCLAQSPGFDPASPEHAREQNACPLRDERRSVPERLLHVERLLDAPGFVTYLPTIDSFLRRRRSDELAASAASLDRIRRHAGARGAAAGLLNGLESPRLRLDVVRVARTLGWLSPEEALPIQRAIVIRLLRPPVWGEGRDAICGMGPDVLARIDLRADEVLPETYRDEFGIQALGCLKPSDERIHAELARSLYDSREWIPRLAASALEEMRTARR